MEQANNTITHNIEALLFYEGGTVTRAYLQKIFKDTPAEDIHAAIAELSKKYTAGGIVLITTEHEISLRVAPASSSFIEEIQSKEFKEDIGPASLETLGILLYRGPSSQVEIDAIRGVNSSFALRHLRMRGLIERGQGPLKNAYIVTTEALAHLGITNSEELPQREEIQKEIAMYESRSHNEARVDNT